MHTEQALQLRHGQVELQLQLKTLQLQQAQQGDSPNFFSLFEKIQEIAEKNGAMASNNLTKVVGALWTYIVNEGGKPKLPN